MSAGRHRQDAARLPADPVDPRILQAVREQALAAGGELDAIALAAAVRQSGAALGSSGARESLQALLNELTGLSVLEPFARRPGVTDVLVDGQGQVWTDSPRGLEATGFSFDTPEQVARLAVHLATLAGQRLDAASPFADVKVRNYRVHAVLPPIATAGPLISIRVASVATLDLGQVLATAPPMWPTLLRAIVERQLNFLITGGTGSGKTTLLRAMLGCVPPTQRLVVVEDTHELQIDHPHAVGLQARAANLESAGRVGLSDLVRQALRMRPDRLVVGECRGAEVRDFLAAMNTGHQGAAGTLHANEPAAVPARLAALGALAGWGLEATSLQAASALDLVIHVARDAQGSRAPVALGQLSTDRQDRLRIRTLIDVRHPAGTGQAELDVLARLVGEPAARSVGAWAAGGGATDGGATGGGT